MHVIVVDKFPTSWSVVARAIVDTNKYLSINKRYASEIKST